MAKVQVGDFIEIEFTGYINGKVFDSNIPEDLKQISPELKPQKTLIIIGQKMVVDGLDKALDGKEIGKEYNIHIKYKEAYGERNRELVKTIPLHVFTKHKINPYPGAVFYLDNILVRIITISGARVITDFNNPLAGKDLDYKFIIKRIISEEKEKLESFFMFFFKFVPEFEVSDSKIMIKGKPAIELLIEIFKARFKEVFKKDLEFKKLEETEKPR